MIRIVSFKHVRINSHQLGRSNDLIGCFFGKPKILLLNYKVSDE